MRILTTILILLLAITAGPAEAATDTTGGRADDAADVLAPFVAVYEARATVLGLGGEVVMEFGPAGEPGVYVFRTVSQPRGLAGLLADEEVECSLLHYENGRLSPLVYHENAGDDSSTIRFDWRKTSAIAQYKDREATLEIEPGVLDRASEQIAVRLDLADGEPGLGPYRTDRASEQIAVRLDLADGEPGLGPYRTIERNEYRTIEYEPEGSAEVSAPAGTYETLAFRRHRVGSSRSVVIHYAPELDWIAVKIEQFKGDKKQVTALLKRYRPGQPGADQARGSVTPRCP
ncbi:MAG: DUF3108 domain-containing protein [Gammaproteobacteria bacterium]